MLRRLVLIVPLVVVAACGGSDMTIPIMCTTQLNSTIVVYITDARTTASAAVGSTVIVRGGAVYDSVFVTSTLFGATVGYVGWEDRVIAGRYSVEVRKQGYVSFLKSDVDVTMDACHSGPGPGVHVALQPIT